MKIILLEKVYNLGNIGDVVSVRDGYSRNYLLPNKKAVPASPKNLLAFETRRAELEKQAALDLSVAKERAEKLAKVEVIISSRAGEGGKLHGSVGAADIAEVLSKTAGESVSKAEVRLPEGPIRQIGEYELVLHLHADVNVPIKINIIPEK